MVQSFWVCETSVLKEVVWFPLQSVHCQAGWRPPLPPSGDPLFAVYYVTGCGLASVFATATTLWLYSRPPSVGAGLEVAHLTPHHY